jgi:hypothetical protein
MLLKKVFYGDASEWYSHLKSGQTLHLSILKVQFAHHQVSLMKMWKNCIMSSMRTTAYD